MRLQEFLNEQYRYSQFAKQYKSKAKRIVNKHLKAVEKELKIHDKITLRKLCMILSSIYMQDKVRFVMDGPNDVKRYKYIKGSDFYKNGDIEIFLSQEAVENINDLLNKGKFYNELVYVIAHAMVHVNRVKKMKDEFNFVGYNPIKKFMIDNMENYAGEAAYELESEGFSPIKSLYHDMIGNLPEYKKFLELIKSY